MTIASWLPPAVREAPAGEERLLDALLAAVGAQYDLLAADVDQVLDDLFVESCADWAVPYIGALLGLPADAERLEVAYAVALRRAKGTPGALEDFAEVVTGLPARVVEGWQVTAWVHQVGHPAPLHPAVLDLRDGSRLRHGTPFERTRRTVTPGGRWAPDAATVVVWPWQVATYVETEARRFGNTRRYALHPLGAQAPLYLKPRPLRLGSDEAGAGRTGDERDAPVRATYDVLQALGPVTYGATLTLPPDHPLATAPGAATPPLLRLSVGGAEVPWAALRFGSLPDGPAPAPPGPGEVVVDVCRGRVQLGTNIGPGRVRATWHRPVAGSMGALASLSDANPAARVVVTVDPDGAGPNVVATLDDAFVAAQALSAGLPAAESRAGVPDVEIRLLTSDRLAAPAPQAFAPAVPRWRIVAPPLMTPTVVGTLDLDLAGACVWLEGFQLAGELRLGAGLRGATLDGITQDPAFGVVASPDAWTLDLAATRCLLGPVRADLAAFPVTLTDCVVDGRRALARPCGDGAATSGPATDSVAAGVRFGPALVADGVTFAGPVRVESADARDCVFTDGVEVVQQQEGCLSHCYLGPALSAPPRHPTTYRCGPYPPPTFVSDGFEAAGYYALALDPPQPLLAAASDGGEVGAYHHVRRAARLRRLTHRVEEFVPLGLRPAVAVAPWEE